LENQEAIDYLNNLKQGMFCTVNIPICNNSEKIPITVMYMGKDEDGRYNFIDTGRFIMSFDEDKAFEIYSKVRMQPNKNKNKERTR